MYPYPFLKNYFLKIKGVAKNGGKIKARKEVIYEYFKNYWKDII